MKGDTNEMVAAMASAFPGWMQGRLEELGVLTGSGIQKAIASAQSTLERDLAELVALPADQQTSSPLELVRRATLGVTEALLEMGVRPPERDDWERDIQPDDTFALYPATSRDLGEDVWQMHLEWGKAKALAVAGVEPRPPAAAPLPSVALFGVPLEEREELQEAIREHGYETLLWRNPAALDAAADTKPHLVLVDLRHPEAKAALRRLSDEGIRCVVLGDVDDLTLPGLLALGAETAVASARIAGRLDGLLPRLV